MAYKIVKGDITDFEVDVIINASNGIGYMGGFIGKYKKLNGVAESIHYKTKGIVEKEAKTACNYKCFLIWRVSGGIRAREIFVTSAGGLRAKYIIHAVTMAYPGMITNIEVIKELLPKICEKVRELKAKTIAIPLLGTGTGRVTKEDVLKLYNEFFANVHDIDITIIII